MFGRSRGLPAQHHSIRFQCWSYIELYLPRMGLAPRLTLLGNEASRRMWLYGCPLRISESGPWNSCEKKIYHRRIMDKGLIYAPGETGVPDYIYRSVALDEHSPQYPQEASVQAGCSARFSESWYQILPHRVYMQYWNQWSGQWVDLRWEHCPNKSSESVLWKLKSNTYYSEFTVYNIIFMQILYTISNFLCLERQNAQSLKGKKNIDEEAYLPSCVSALDASRYTPKNRDAKRIAIPNPAED